MLNPEYREGKVTRSKEVTLSDNSGVVCTDVIAHGSPGASHREIHRTDFTNDRIDHVTVHNGKTFSYYRYVDGMEYRAMQVEWGLIIYDPHFVDSVAVIAKAIALAEPAQT